MKSLTRCAKCLACCLGFCLCALAVAQPYYSHLDSEKITEAYELGRHRDEAMAAVLSKYIQTFPTPQKGPYIGWIEVRTPYVQVVYAADEDMLSGSELDAVQKYERAKLPVIVRVRVYWPPTNEVYSDEDSEKDMWKEFPIVVSQGRPLTATSKKLIPYHMVQRGMARFDYTDMQLEFSASKISSQMLTIVASSPDGQHVRAKFDL